MTFKEPPQKLLTSKFFFETIESPALRFNSDGVSSLLCGEQTNKKSQGGIKEFGISRYKLILKIDLKGPTV